MILIHLRHAFRSLRRNTTYTLINFIGLGLACAFIVLVVLFVGHETRIDTFHAKGPRLFRIEMTNISDLTDTTPQRGFFATLAGSAEEKNIIVTPVVLAIDLKKNFPEVQDVVRMTKTWRPVVRIGQQNFAEDGEKVAYVDNSFFSVFSFPLLSGNPSNAFPDHNSVVISESAAHKYFGSDNPVGKTLSISTEENRLFKVSAVVKDFPGISSMHFDVMLPVEGSSDYDERLRNGTNQLSHLMVVELTKDADIAAFRQKLRAFGKKYFKDWIDEWQQLSGEKHVDFRLDIRPFAEAHFNKSQGWFQYTDLSGMFELIALTLVAVIISCLNYILISMSKVAAHSQETGIRRVIGATKMHIITGCLTETFVLVLLSVLAGLLISIVALPYFNRLTAAEVSFSELFRPEMLALLLGIIALLTLAAGIYPALVTAGIRPISLLRKFSTYKLNPALSRMVVVVQYTACIVLIFFAVVIGRQMNFVYNKDLGFARGQVLMVEDPYVMSTYDLAKSALLHEEIRQYAATHPAITDMTSASLRLGDGLETNGHVINGKREMISSMIVDFNFFDFNKIPIIRGRAFSTAFPSDSSRLNIAKAQRDTTSSAAFSYLVVNETLYKLLGQPPLNVINRSLAGIIIGVCKDYHFQGLQQQIGPEYHRCRPARANYYWLRIRNGQDVAPVVDNLKKTMASLTGNAPFNYSFLDEDIRKMYESDKRWMSIISIASFSAILIACLGLFGLSAIVSISRTREIGIRKVLGAEIAALYLNLNKGTLIMIGISIIIALPIAQWIATNWLRSFAYRIELDWSIYTLSTLLAVVCALLAVSYHTLRAAMANPIDSLRSE